MNALSFVNNEELRVNMSVEKGFLFVAREWIPSMDGIFVTFWSVLFDG